MQTVDSNQKLLDIPSIMTMASDQLGHMYNGNSLNMETILATLAKETSLPNADVVQVGNTVFIGHTGEGKNKSKMHGRPLNVDTSRNFIRNMLKYGVYLQDKDITHYSTYFKGSALIPAMKIMQKRLMSVDTDLFFGQPEDEDGHIVYIRLGDDPLDEIF